MHHQPLKRVCHVITEFCNPRHHSYQRLLESMLAFYNGGSTNWEPPLKAAVECIEKQQHFNGADIVMITDGKCDVEVKFVKELKAKKEQLEFSIYGVLIGSGAVTKLSKFCDRIWAVKDLTSQSDVIEELFLL